MEFGRQLLQLIQQMEEEKEDVDDALALNFSRNSGIVDQKWSMW